MKPCLHDGTVTVEQDRLVEIPPSIKPLDDRIELAITATLVRVLKGDTTMKAMLFCA